MKNLLIKLWVKVFEIKTKDDSHALECNYANNYYGDQQCKLKN